MKRSSRDPKLFDAELSGSLTANAVAFVPRQIASATSLGFSVRFDGVTYNDDGTSTWTYWVDANRALRGLSFVVVGTCGSGHTGSAGVWGVGTYERDPHTGIWGVKWEDHADTDFKNGTLGPFMITLNGWYAAGTVDWGIKAGAERSGGGVEMGTVAGATCQQILAAVDDSAVTQVDTPVGSG